MSEIQEDVAERLDGHTRVAIERIVTKFQVLPNPNPKSSEESLEVILDNFWKDLTTSRIKLDPMDITLEGS